jgi:hypothetical protein
MINIDEIEFLNGKRGYRGKNYTGWCSFLIDDIDRGIARYVNGDLVYLKHHVDNSILEGCYKHSMREGIHIKYLKEFL